MPRDIPLGNGRLLVNFDKTYQIRDLFFPHVGMENHITGYPCRFGVWVDGVFSWVADDRWRRTLLYEPDATVTAVRLECDNPKIALRITDVVDFAVNLMVRKFVVERGSGRDVRLFLHHDFHIYGHAIGDTALYRPDLRAIVHYKDARYLIVGGRGASGAIDAFAVGQKEIGGAEGTWRDAEDGELSGNPIVQGAVDSTVAIYPPGNVNEERIAYAWLGAGFDMEAVELLHKRATENPELFIDRTRNYWRLWANKEQTDFGPMPQDLINLYKRSLLIIRTQTDDEGGILAANDTDIQEFAGDTYSYVWPRDGALVAYALDEAGRHELSNAFFKFCTRVIHKGGYFLHKYNADGTLASSWHPYYHDGHPRLPIQEDETALVLWSLWHHFELTRSIESIREFYNTLIIPAAEFLASYVDHAGMIKASYDLWEERWGVHAYTVGAVYGGLLAGANFATAFGETQEAARYAEAANRLKEAVLEQMYDSRAKRFARMLSVNDRGAFTSDMTMDAAIWALLQFGMFSPDDPALISTLDQVFDRLWVKTDVGGVARYENDYYHQISHDIGNVPGNPWFICTLWRARYVIARARTREELETALPLLQWVAERALPSGVLAEQVNPYDDMPLSVSPLTWSHAEFVTAFLAYLDKLSTLEFCPTCGKPQYMREHQRRLREAIYAANARMHVMETVP
ncbi:MAG TPA: glycoside hydrolase family 15 protein [Candidatus Acidoferrales bacterium]|nr:glycoside hydrolase family 15 protein [Candidatus Acidoferrales bacterium]